ncbi:MAG: hypothetical protein DMG65_04765 [Candidatus Angelobacter sp. Gp1-AA117]|nr:MAG: hypothetical protein DMG65_04765 [Candidatus Angelobacter sp. Gp1-AA117]
MCSQLRNATLGAAGRTAVEIRSATAFPACKAHTTWPAFKNEAALFAEISDDEISRIEAAVRAAG